MPRLPTLAAGQGSASRSTLPDDRVGKVSTTTSRGTKGAGMVDRSRASDVRASNDGSVAT